MISVQMISTLLSYTQANDDYFNEIILSLAENITDGPSPTEKTQSPW